MVDIRISSTELTYCTNGKGTSISQQPLDGIWCLFPGGYTKFAEWFSLFEMLKGPTLPTKGFQLIHSPPPPKVLLSIPLLFSAFPFLGGFQKNNIAVFKDFVEFYTPKCWGRWVFSNFDLKTCFFFKWNGVGLNSTQTTHPQQRKRRFPSMKARRRCPATSSLRRPIWCAMKISSWQLRHWRLRVLRWTSNLVWWCLEQCLLVCFEAGFEGTGDEGNHIIYLCIYLLCQLDMHICMYIHIICEFMGCLSNMSYQSIAWEGWAGLCFFEGARGVLPFRGNLPDCLLMFQGMSKITSKRLQEIPP